MNKITENIGEGKPGPGRPKGSVNKTTALMKDAITAVYADLQGDFPERDNGHFYTWAVQNPTEFYKLASKLIPIQVGGEDGGAITVVINKP
jgi:hypothetical protein